MSADRRSAPASWQQLQELFDAAIAAPVAERSALVGRACTRHPDLCGPLRSLLAAHEALSRGDGGFLSVLDPDRAAVLVKAAGDDADLPELVGRYRVLRRLGEGGMGVVYLAVDPHLDRQVALKVLSGRLSGDAAASRRFIEEARSASSLDHPNIATVFEIAESADRRLFIAMAYYDGDTVRRRLHDGRLAVEIAVDVGIQLARALAAAHRRGIVHRDVKPENVVLTADGVVKLLDFGIARARAGTATAAGTMLGTVSYMSPEQTRGGAVDHRSDLWSLGVVLYEMLAGCRPFTGDTHDVVLHGIRHDAPPRLSEVRPNVPPALAAVVERCLAKQPSQRFESAAALEAALGAALSPAPGASLGQSVSGAALAPPASGAALSPSAAQPSGGGPARTRRWRAAAALLVLACAGGGAGALALRGGAPRVTAAQGSAEGVFAERGWVLLADVEAPEDAADVALAVREALAVDLQQSQFVNVYGRLQLGGVLERMGLPPAAPLELTQALEAAQRAGAGAVLSVTVSRLGPQYVLSGRALRPEDGAELFAVRTAATPQRLVRGVQTLSREMRRRLGEERTAIRRSMPLPEVTTQSLAALQLYSAAEKAALLRDDARAASLLAAAIGEDPSFAMAHRAAGILAWNQLRFGDAVEHLEQAYRLRGRLTDRERWHVEAMYFGNVTLEPSRAADAYEALLARYPDDARAAINRASLLQTWESRNEEAWSAIMHVSQPESRTWPFFANAIHLAYVTDRTAEAERLAALAEEQGYADVAIRWRVGRAFAEGDQATAAAMCDAILAGPQRAAAAAHDLEICGSMDVAAGRLRRGAARLQQIEQQYLAQRRHRNLAHVTQALAVIDVLRQQTARAAARLDALLERVPADELPEPDRFITRTNLQLQAAVLGAPELVDRIGIAYPDYPDAGHWLARTGNGLVAAALAATGGDGSSALQHLDMAVPNDRRPVGWRIWEELIRGLAHDALGHADSAAIRFRRAADPAYLALEFATKDRIYLPLALRRQADAEAAAGNAHGATRTYQRLLELWADADQELRDEILSARSALARIDGSPAGAGVRR